MTVLTWILGILGGLCAIMGIVTAAGIDTMLSEAFNALFWLGLATVLMLGCVAAAVSRTVYE